jgi:hypothetical protein
MKKAKELKVNYTCIRLTDKNNALLDEYCLKHKIKKSTFIRKCLVKEISADAK